MAKQYKIGFVIDARNSDGVKVLKRTREEVDKLDKQTDKAKTSTNRWRDSNRQNNQMLDSAKRLVVGLAGAAGIGLLVRKFKDVTVSTELLKGQLVTMTGSTEAAGAAFDSLVQFAEKTPFTLNQSVEAFIKLKAMGLDPSERALQAYGNTAAAMGKDMTQMIEAVADAATMEFERLKEFGIRARQQADTVTFTFQGVSTTVAKESAAIEEYLMGIGETQFGDAMANQMERLPGMLSNLEDSVDNFFRAVADDGGLNIFKSAVGGASEAVGFATENLDEISMAAEAMAVLMAGRFAGGVLAAAQGMNTATTSAVALRRAMAFLTGPAGLIMLATGATWAMVEAKQREAAAIDDVVRSLYDQIDALGTMSQVQLSESIRANEKLIASRKAEAAEVEKSVELLRELGSEQNSEVDKLRRLNLQIQELEGVRDAQERQLDRLINKEKLAAAGIYEMEVALERVTAASFGANGSFEEIVITAERATAEMYGIGGAAGSTASDLEGLGGTTTAVTDQMNRDFENTRDFMADMFANGMKDWEEILEATLKRMLAQLVASDFLNAVGKLGNFLSGQGGVLGGIGDLIGNIPGIGAADGAKGLMDVISSIGGASGSAAVVGGGTAVGGSIAGIVGGSTAAGGAAAALPAGWSVTGAGTSAAAGGGFMSGIGGAIAAVPGWGWALAGLGVAGAVLGGNDDDHDTAILRFSENAPRTSRTSDIPPFASGVDAWVYHDQVGADTVADMVKRFSELDAAMTEAAKAAGLNVSLSSSDLAMHNHTGLGLDTNIGMHYGTSLPLYAKAFVEAVARDNSMSVEDTLQAMGVNEMPGAAPAPGPKLGLGVSGMSGFSGYANGGLHGGGWRIVGERGPELEFTGPSRIFSHSDSQKMLDTSGIEQGLSQVTRAIVMMADHLGMKLDHLPSIDEKLSMKSSGYGFERFERAPA